MMIKPTDDRAYGARNYSEILAEGLGYINDRRHGRIKSFKTPWLGFNRAGINGLEWGSLLTIGARPGSGKTMISSQILREARTQNPDQDFNILEFQFEMGAKQSASRAFAAEVALDYNVVLSTDRQLDDYVYGLMQTHLADVKAMEAVGIRRIQINKPLTNKEIVDAVHLYYNKLGGKPMIITIDHSWLIKKNADEREKIATLYNTVEALMQLKNELPVIIIMLTQLNRTIDDPSRKNPGSVGNFPTSSDIFGGDALMQGSDMVAVLNRPYKSDIKIYGPRSYECKSEDVFMHLLKNRNNSDDNNLIYLKMDGVRQRMIEVAEPASRTLSGNSGTGKPKGRTIGQFTTCNISADIGDEL